MTRVIAHYLPERDTYEVYIVDALGGFLTPDAVVTPGPGEPGPAFLTVPSRWAREIGEALAPRPQATERHLDDAIAVRDRLLALVEREASRGRVLTPREAEARRSERSEP